MSSYYKTIDHVKYDRSLLEHAEKATKDGPMSAADAKSIWEDAEDGPGVTPTERRTIQYITEKFKLDPDAAKFLDGKLGGEFKTIDGVQYKRSLLDAAEEGEKCVTLADAKALWADAMDEDGVDDCEKRTLEKVMKDHKFATDGQEFLQAALKGEKLGDMPLVGKRVHVHSTSRPDMNGKSGVATSFDKERGRYVVDLDGEKEIFRFKPKNLKEGEGPAKTADDSAQKVAAAEKARKEAEKEAHDLAKSVADLEKRLAEAEKKAEESKKEVDAFPEKLQKAVEKWEASLQTHIKENNLIADFIKKESTDGGSLAKKQRTA